jgi:dienelactone hydrolase
MVPVLVGGAILSGTSASAASAASRASAPSVALAASAAGGRRSAGDAVVVTDVQVRVAGQKPVAAYLVSPVHRSRSVAGVMYLHWFEPPASTQNRTEFLAEAVDIASRGAVAILPQLTFPWESDPVGDTRDRAAVETQLAALNSVYAFLLDQRGVDPRRTAVVGHDYGAMYGALLAQRQRRVKAAVLMTPDATWANWFDTYWLGLPDEQKAAYRSVFAGLDPVDNVDRPGVNVYFQFAGRDQFVSAETRAAFAAANPAAKVSLYDRADHFLQQPAKDDRIAWLTAQLALQ